MKASGAANAAREDAAGESYVSVYVSFDIRHDRELYERLLDQSTSALRHAGPWFLVYPLYLRASLAVRRGSPDEAIGFAEGEGAKEDAADGAEDRGVCADPEREGENGDNRKPGASAQTPHRMPQVTSHGHRSLRWREMFL